MAANRMKLDNVDIKFEFGSLCINILWLRTADFNKSTYIDFHYHSGYELHIIPSGYGHLSLEDRTYVIRPQTIYLTGPDVYHEQKTNPHNPMEEYCINFEIAGNASPAHHTLTGKDLGLLCKTLAATHFWFGRDAYGICELFERIIEETQNKTAGYYESIKNYLLQIFINMTRCFASSPESCEAPPAKDTNDSRRIIIDEYLQQLEKKQSVKILARKAGLSVRQLNRIMLEYYGKSYHRQLTETRMKRAAGLLKNTHADIKTVSEKVGFTDAAYFSRVFKKYWGIPPAEYRKGSSNVWKGSQE